MANLAAVVRNSPIELFQLGMATGGSISARDFLVIYYTASVQTNLTGSATSPVGNARYAGPTQ